MILIYYVFQSSTNHKTPNIVQLTWLNINIILPTHHLIIYLVKYYTRCYFIPHETIDISILMTIPKVVGWLKLLITVRNYYETKFKTTCKFIIKSRGDITTLYTLLLHADFEMLITIVYKSEFNISRLSCYPFRFPSSNVTNG